MQVQLRRPTHAQFIADEVKAGHFPSPEGAVEAAIEQMILDRESTELDDETIAAINRAEEEFDRGEGIEFEKFAAEMRKQFPTG